MDAFDAINKKVREELDSFFRNEKLFTICNVIDETLRGLDIKEFGDYQLCFVAKKIKNSKELIDLLAVISSDKRLDGSYSGIGFGIVPPLKKKIERDRV